MYQLRMYLANDGDIIPQDRAPHLKRGARKIETQYYEAAMKQFQEKMQAAFRQIADVIIRCAKGE